jgi:hypothetical protein
MVTCQLVAVIFQGLARSSGRHVAGFEYGRVLAADGDGVRTIIHVEGGEVW